MNTFRRIIAIFLVTSVLTTALPTQIFAANDYARIAVTSVTSSFDPTSKKVAKINYTVNGPATAIEVLVRVYSAVNLPTEGTRNCNYVSTNLISNLEPVSNKPIGTYTSVWNGKNLAGNTVPPAYYCYVISWANAQAGALNFVNGIIRVDQPGTGTGETVSSTEGTGTGSTGTNTGTGTPNNGPCDTNQLICATVDPNVIDPNATEGNSAYITYTVNKTLNTGFALKVYDSNGYVVKDLYSTNQTIFAGTRETKPWNGKRNTGTAVTPGDYFYKFKVNGNDVANGLIRVEYTNVGGGVTQPSNTPNIVFYANPSVIDPLATPAQVATVYWTVNRQIPAGQGLALSIRNFNDSILKTLYSTNDVINVGNYQKSWTGKIESGTNAGCAVPTGSYRYVFTSGSSEIGSGTITVQYSTPDPCRPVSNQFIVSENVSRSSINTGNNETATISYTLGKTVNGFRLFVRNNSTNAEVTLLNLGTEAVSSHTFVWNGKDFNTPVSTGVYSYYFAATNETTVRGATDILVTSSTVDNTTAPVITDQGPSNAVINPTSQNTNEKSTSINFRVNQDAKADVTIFRDNLTTVRRVLSSGNGFWNNVNANQQYSPTWDGIDDNGYLVSDGTYTYSIQAYNNNGTAQTRSGTVTVRRSGNPSGVMDVTNLSVDPNPFNLNSYSNAALRFNLNNSGYVTVTVYNDSGAFIRTVTSNEFFSSGANYVNWNGKDSNGNTVADANYSFRVDANNATYGNDSATFSFRVSNATNNGLLDIYSAYANPNPFNPDTQNSYLYFTINHDANVTASIVRSNGDLVKNLTTNQLYFTGTSYIVWDGKDYNGTFVSNDVYTFRVSAYSSNYGSDSTTANVTVNKGGNNQNLQITDNGASPNPFDPRNNQYSYINFSVNTTPSQVAVKILRRSDNTVIRELPVTTVSSNVYRAEWNGRDSSSNYVAYDTYTYRIDVTSSGQTAVRTGSITAQAGVTPVDGNCGNFTDVSNTNSLCTAIEFVKSKGIFAGYPDGSIGLDRVIQRAELLAVIQKAFKYPLETYTPSIDGNLGFKDLSATTNYWYMPYIKTFLKYKSIAGYPDKQVRPDRTMNTAELYLVFLKAAKASPAKVANFTLANHELSKFKAYLDTPTGTWYIKYAGFAKLNGLVTTEYFYPGRGITRGQVIKLVYDTYKKGLITY